VRCPVSSSVVQGRPRTFSRYVVRYVVSYACGRAHGDGHLTNSNAQISLARLKAIRRRYFVLMSSTEQVISIYSCAPARVGDTPGRYATPLPPPCNQLLEEVDTLARPTCGCGMKGKEEGQALNTRIERLHNSSHPVIESSPGLALAYQGRKRQLLVDLCGFSCQLRNTACCAG
jgi:hypothetical protein